MVLIAKLCVETTTGYAPMSDAVNDDFIVVCAIEDQTDVRMVRQKVNDRLQAAPAHAWRLR